MLNVSITPNIDSFTCYACWIVVIYLFKTVHMLLDKIIAESRE